MLLTSTNIDRWSYLTWSPWGARDRSSRRDRGSAPNQSNVDSFNGSTNIPRKYINIILTISSASSAGAASASLAHPSSARAPLNDLTTRRALSKLLTRCALDNTFATMVTPNPPVTAATTMRRDGADSQAAVAAATATGFVVFMLSKRVFTRQSRWVASPSVPSSLLSISGGSSSAGKLRSRSCYPIWCPRHSTWPGLSRRVGTLVIQRGHSSFHHPQYRVYASDTTVWKKRSRSGIKREMLHATYLGPTRAAPACHAEQYGRSLLIQEASPRWLPTVGSIRCQKHVRQMGRCLPSS